MASFACFLCERGGRETLAPRYGRTVICRDCVAWLQTSGRRWCNQARHVVSADAWSRLGSCCVACDRERRRERYERTRERVLAIKRQQWQTKRDAVNARRRAKAPTPEQVERRRARQRARYHANPEPARERKRRYWARNRDRKNELNRLYRRRRLLRILRGEP